ncbi:MAG: MoaD/ThiS family protein [Candidatus Thorarchaeota archaeon]|nr:MAG: MoaD/ThiS family protein [Candidatus Thorarchaeota archaeon]
MRVLFKSFGPIQRLLGKKIMEVEVPEGSTVRQVVDTVVKQSGEDLAKLIMDQDRINGNLIVILNRKDVDTLGGIDIIVSEGDEIAILPHVQGG